MNAMDRRTALSSIGCAAAVGFGLALLPQPAAAVPLALEKDQAGKTMPDAKPETMPKATAKTAPETMPFADDEQTTLSARRVCFWRRGRRVCEWRPGPGWRGGWRGRPGRRRVCWWRRGRRVCEWR